MESASSMVIPVDDTRIPVVFSESLASQPGQGAQVDAIRANRNIKATWKNNFRVEDDKVCYICNVTTLGLHLFTKHLRMHNNDSGPFPCHICNRPMSHGLALHDHMRGHYKGQILDDGTENNRCDEPGCEKVFKSRNALAKHIQNDHAGIRQNTYSCPECRHGIAFTCFNVRDFREHMLKLHGRKPFECTQCGNRYMTKANLEDHKSSRHNDGVKSFFCDVCVKAFATKSLLFAHRKEQHETPESERRIKCKSCDFYAAGPRNLRKHMEIHDLNAYKKFQCAHCSRMFRTKNGLVCHERTHTGEAPYRCHICSINFKRLHHLGSHLKSGNHSNKLKQLEAEGISLSVEDIYSKDNKDGRKESKLRSGTDPQRVQLALHQNASEGLRASSEELQDVSQVVAGDEVGPQFTVQEIDGQQIYITDISSAAAVHIADDVTGLDLQNAVLLTETDHGYEETEYEQFIID